MRRKLAAKGFKSEEIAATIKELEAQNLLDDSRFAELFALALAQEKLFGPQRLSLNFYQKGIPPDLAEAAIEKAEAVLPSKERLQKLISLRLKGRFFREMSPKEKKRLVDTLRRRGFPWEDIQEVLQESGGISEE